jgi:hypothetical protein
MNDQVAIITGAASGVGVTEEIVGWDPLSRYAYRLISSAPLSNDTGEVSVTADGRGSRVRRAVRFRSRLPLTGPLIATLVSHPIARALAGLARARSEQTDKNGRPS